MKLFVAFEKKQANFAKINATTQFNKQRVRSAYDIVKINC